MNYNEFWRIRANNGNSKKHIDYSKSYTIVNFTEYANSFYEFIEKYPKFVIDTVGEAKSKSTFGDASEGCFGPLTFETINFDCNGFYNEYAVHKIQSKSFYTVGVKIGFGFKRGKDLMYFRPFIHGWIYNEDTNLITLSFGLGVASIIFLPKSTQI